MVRRSLVVMVSLLAAAGCKDRIGKLCDIGVDNPGNTAVVASPALDCETSRCAKVPVDPGKQVPPGFHALPSNRGMCTAQCSTDDDCTEVDPASPCATGFTCAVAVTVGPFCCQRYCICRDYVVVPASGTIPPPASCDPAQVDNACCNLAGRPGNPMYPNCP